MATTYGLTPAGFVPKPIDAVKADLDAAVRGEFGDSFPLDEKSLAGQYNASVSQALAELWDVAEATYHSRDPDSAEGEALVEVCALTGTVPDLATPSLATLTCWGTAGTVLALGRIASVVGTGSRFDTTQAATILAALAWVAATPYAVGDKRTNDGGKLYACIATGVSAGAGGPTGTALDITDGSVHWAYVATATAFADVPAQSEDLGPVIGSTRTITQIETPVAGWTGVVNLADAVLGAALETDPQLRTRREEELPGEGRSTVDALREHLLKVPGVVNATIFSNETDAVNGDGLPPHSVECLVQGGADQDIIDAIFANKPASAATYGSTTGTHVDAANGNQSYTIKFSRPTTHPIYVIANVTVDASKYPLDGDAQVAAAILAKGNESVLGLDVFSLRLKAPCFGVAGVLDVPTLYIDTAPSPASQGTIVLGIRDLALFDSARITVNSTPGTP